MLIIMKCWILILQIDMEINHYKENMKTQTLVHGTCADLPKDAGSYKWTIIQNSSIQWTYLDLK